MSASLQEAQQASAFTPLTNLSTKASLWLHLNRLENYKAELELRSKAIETPKEIPSVNNAQDEYGDTPLMEASRRGNYEEIEKLLAENPKSIDIQDENGMNALMHALYEGEEEIAKDLVSKTDLSKKDNFGWTVLHYAVRLGSIHMVQLFLRISNIKVDAQDIFGQTPLTIAAKVNPEILRTLKQYKCRRK